MLNLAFFRDVLAPGAILDLPAGPNRVLFCWQGKLTVRAAGMVAALAPNSAWHRSTAAVATAGNEGAEVYRWELHRGAAPAGTKLASPLSIDPSQPWLMRCDRVDFPLGGIAWTHTHQGPGTRCTLTGEMRVASAGHELRAAAGEPWFESGPDPVLAHASEATPTSFARVMILPAALLGKSSIRYVLPEDQDKPKRQTYQLFIDEPIDLG
ncbi:MAG: hypothetical protein EXR31_06740 [Betaproteobacteria bacterium]|nr:hypothetical protein [Betaproteobacteria bacterium]